MRPLTNLLSGLQNVQDSPCLSPSTSFGACPESTVNRGNTPDNNTGARDGTRTRNSHLGRVELYQLSYSRISEIFFGCPWWNRTTTLGIKNPCTATILRDSKNLTFKITEQTSSGQPRATHHCYGFGSFSSERCCVLPHKCLSLVRCDDESPVEIENSPFAIQCTSQATHGETRGDKPRNLPSSCSRHLLWHPHMRDLSPEGCCCRPAFEFKSTIFLWSRGRDSNPRGPCGLLITNQAQSTTMRPRLQLVSSNRFSKNHVAFTSGEATGHILAQVA